jgi:hypothetical protein
MKKLLITFITAFFLLFNFNSFKEKIKIEPETLTYQHFLENDPVLNAIAYVESNHDTSAINKTDGGTGLLQITPVMVYDINRINRLKGIPIYYSLEDRFNPYKSIEMYYIFNNYYKHSEPEEIARAWNSGPKWYTKTHKTDRYWEKVQETLESAP